MFGGSDNNNPMIPVFMGNCFQYDANALPQLQLFGDFPVGCSADPLNYMGNEQTTTTNQPVKRVRETEPASRQQKLHISLNNNFLQDETAQAGRMLNQNQNPVSTGLRLSYEEDERNSSITSASDGIKGALPGILSLGDSIKVEIDRQKEEFDQYFRLQEAKITKGIRDLKQRQTASLINALERGVGRKLQEKELEIENMNRKNKELAERIKQVATEAQTWHYRAKYNESVVSALKSNLQQVIAQSAIHAKEGFGDSSEVDDTASNANPNPNHPGGSGACPLTKTQLTCRACKCKEVSVVLLPCRHLCLCRDCEGFIDVCPVCLAMKIASVKVLMP